MKQNIINIEKKQTKIALLCLKTRASNAIEDAVVSTENRKILILIKRLIKYIKEF